MEKKNYYIVDEKGEVVDEIVAEEGTKGRLLYVEEGDRVLKRNSLLAYGRRKGKYEKADIDFVKVIRNLDNISYSCPIVITLLRYIGYEDNVLMHSNGKRVTPSSLSRITGISLSTCKRQFKKLMELEVIRRTKTEIGYVYIFNPYVANCSKEIDIETLNMFRKSRYWEGQ